MISSNTVATGILSNGCKYLNATIPQSAGFELSITLNSGSRDETQEKNGVSHFLEHMMFRGSNRFPDSIKLAKALEGIGGETNAMTSQENTTYWLKGAASKFEHAVEIFAEFFHNPVFADLETERTVILNELASDYNENNELIDIESVSFRELFGAHPLGLPIIGNAETIKNMQIEDLIDKRNKNYFPTNCVISVISSLSENLIQKLLETHFGQKWHYAKNSTTQNVSSFDFETFCKLAKPNNFKLINNPDNQFYLKILWPAYGGNNGKIVYQTFLQRLLDDGIYSRLPARIREKHGLAYEVTADSNAFRDIGTFSVDVTTHQDQIEPLILKLTSELEELLNHLPSDDELDHVRFRYLHDLDLVEESPALLANRKSSQIFNPGDLSIQEERDIVSSITKFDILLTSQAILGNSKKTIALIGPKARKKRDLLEKLSLKTRF